MRDEPRKVWAKAIPRLLGIAALAALFLAGVRGERAPERLSQFQQAARRLRVGMTMPEVWAATKFADDSSFVVGGSSYSHFASFFNPRRRELLQLNFLVKEDPLTGHYEQRLVDWNVSSH
jgi:hypothetical protein